MFRKIVRRWLGIDLLDHKVTLLDKRTRKRRTPTQGLPVYPTDDPHPGELMSDPKPEIVKGYERV